MPVGSRSNQPGVSPSARLLASRHVGTDGRVTDLGGTLPRDRRFPVASVSKTLTALLVARLAVDGALSWSEPVPALARPVTWRSLLGHTARLPLELRPDHWHTSALTAAQLSDALPALPNLGLPPGSWHYSNLGYGVAARALEELTDRAYPELLADHLLLPLGMRATSLPAPSEPVGVLGAAAAAGDLRSTLDDLMILGQALAGGRPDVISWPMLALLLEELVADGRGEHFGAGIRTYRTGVHQVLISSGTILGHTTCVTGWPRRGASVVVAGGAADHGALRDTAVARWRREDEERGWWLDGQEVRELRHGIEVELVLRETTWPYPLFAGHQSGDSLTGIDWRGEPVTLTDYGDALVGAGLRLAAEPDRSAWVGEELR